MQFITLEVGNFLSFKHAKINLQDRGLVLVEGINLDSNAADGNGAGKSALIVEALLWGLFGRTARGVSGDDVIMRNTTGNTYARVAWQDTNHMYQVERTQQPNGLTFSCDGKPVGQSDKRRTQKQIEETLGFDLNVALYALVLGQDSLNFADAPDSAKKQVFETVFRFDLMKQANDKAKKLITKLEYEESNLANLIDIGRGDLQRKNEKLCQTMNEQDAWQIEQAQTIEALEQQARVMQSERSTAPVDQQELSKLTININALTELAVDHKLMVAEIPTIDARVRSLHSEIHSTVSRVKQLKESTQFDEVCPVCKQKIPAADIKRLRGIADEALKEAAELDNQGEELFVQIHQLGDLKRVTNLCIEDMSNSLLQKPFLEEEKRQLEAKVNQNDRLEAEIASINVKIEQCRAAKCPLDALIEALNQEIMEINEKIEKNSAKIVSLKQKMAYLEFWKVGFSRKGLQSYVLDTILPFLTAKANEYANILCDNDIVLSFSTTRQTKTAGERDDFTIECTNRHGAALYAGNSGGERDRINFAVTLALQALILHRLGIDLNYAVFDECVPYTDREGVERVIRLLKSLKRSTIFFVSHSPYYADYFPNRLKIVKENGVSKIE